MVDMLRRALAPIGLAICVCASASAQEARKDKVAEPNNGNAVTQVSPIFGQLLLLGFPRGFKPAFEKTNGNSYIREAVLDGETVDKWTQMVTVTGAKGLAANASVTPELFVTQIAAGFKRACPETLAVKRLGLVQISGVSGQDAFAGLVGCGTVLTSITPHSEGALLVAIKGAADYYTIQWAERGPASDRVDLGDAKWTDRLKALSPIKVCPLVPGEAAPYPSCINQK
jgi:hypothetical protein